MSAFNTAWVFLKSDVLEKDYRAALRAARREGLPSAMTSAIKHPMGDIDSQMAPTYSPDMDEEDQMSPEDAEMEMMLQRRLAEMEQQRRNVQPLRPRPLPYRQSV
mgnify:CR=1 FL=1|tara:strand:+ start:138 stop:452 length:315 start_codon:yes stop_codon:yes gene_type:complete